MEAVGEERGTEFDRHEALLVPERFERSSYEIRGRVMPRAATPVVEIGTAVRADRTDELSPKTRDRLLDIQRELGSREASLRVETTDENPSAFSFTEDAPVIAPGDEPPETRTSHSVVYGVCLRINRRRRDATVQLHDGSRTKLKKLDDEQHIRGTSLHDTPIYIWFKLADAPFAEGVELRMRWEAGTEKGWLDFHADEYLLDHTNRALANICRTLHDNSTSESNDPDP